MRFRLTSAGLGVLTVALCTMAMLPAQAPARAVVLIVSDGLRWQEVFRGADPLLMNAENGGVEDVAALQTAFGGEDTDRRREELMPFFWRVVARQGELFGDRDLGAQARVANSYHFSYPGYNEMLTGAADPRINTNSFGPNPNRTVVEWLNRQPNLRGTAAVFGTWDAFTDIFNDKRSGLFLRAAWQPPQLGNNPAELELDRLYSGTTRLWSDLAYDAFMQEEVLDYLHLHHPRMLFVGYGETDEWAHAGRYDQVLWSAHRFDDFVRQLWEAMQADPLYRGRTDFVLTTDHGRGSGLEDWKNHGATHPGSGNIWIALLGPGLGTRGVAGTGSRVTQSQIAATLAALTGYDWNAANPIAAPPLPLARGRRDAGAAESAKPNRALH